MKDAEKGAVLFARTLLDHLDSSGRKCEQCGGTSYTLASGLAATARHAVAGWSSTGEIVPRSGRVLPFEAALAKAADLRSVKIA